MELNEYSYDEIDVGKVFEFKRKISTEDVDSFSKLTKDFNPLHNDHEYAKNTEFNDRIVHGMLAGSLFSTLLGMVCPGKKNLYLSQNLNFRKPIYLDSEVLVRGKIKNKIDSIRVLVIETQIMVGDSVIIEGEAKVKVMD
tara:strand:- start:14 stop:433 length:420 start_codon:yes stop_codon:yes gene_type:complete